MSNPFFSPQYRPVVIAFLGIVIAVLINWLTNFYNPDILKEYFGENHKMALGLITVLFVLLFLILNHQQENNQSISSLKSNKPYNIANTKENRVRLQQAKDAIGKGQIESALRHLTDFNNPSLNEAITLLSARLAAFERNKVGGVTSYNQDSRTLNSINQTTLSIISKIENEWSQGADFYKTIKEYLKKRYSTRLNQKLAGRQPVNLRRLPTTEGTSEETNTAFVAYGTDEIKVHIVQTFRDAHGRLLITGVPGAGKTTLLLQLELALLESEPDAPPAILNLATWKKEYITLDTWLKEILPAELGVSKQLAIDILQQDNLILLFDGFDEIKEENRESCLEAIGRYGSEPNRRFVITSRIDEYKQVAKDAPVYLQIEIGALTIEQIESELNSIGYSQPEALPLLQAIRQDVILREAVQVPFYFNALQLLFAGGKRLSDLHFKSDTVIQRQAEITEQFVTHELSAVNDATYTPIQAQKWLSFLAFNMTKYNKVVFELVDLQYYWCTLTWWEMVVANFVNGFVIGLLYGLLYGFLVGFLVGFLGGLLGGLLFGPLGGLLVGLLGGLLDGLKKRRPFIGTKDGIKWSWKIYTLFLNKNLLSNLIISVLGSLFMGLTIGSHFGLLFTMLFCLLLCLLSCLLLCLIDYIENDINSIIQINHPYQRFKASAKVLYFSILQHYHLLYLLNRKGLFPFKLVPFFQDMTNSNILEFDSATWRFRHRILQDYFTERREIEANDYEAYLSKGDFLFNNKNNRAEAIKYYQKATEIMPNDHKGYIHLGFSFIILGDIAQAEKILNKAVELGSLDYGNINLGHVYLCKGEKDKANTCYKISLNHFKEKDIFWMGMKDDLQYLTQYGITEVYSTPSPMHRYLNKFNT